MRTDVNLNVKVTRGAGRSGGHIFLVLLELLVVMPGMEVSDVV